MTRRIPCAVIAAFVCLCASWVHAGQAAQAPAKPVTIPQTLEDMKRRMGGGYEYVDKDELLIVSDLDRKTLYQLVSRDFLIYMHVLKRDFFTKGAAGKKSARPILTVFLFQNRESYVAGLRRIGIDVAEEDENNQGAVRNGYFYGGKGRNFILINYRDNYERGISTYAHELTHALLGREFPRPPAWLNEGLATMVGHSRVVNSHLRYTPDASLGRIRKAVAKGEAPPLTAILEMTGADFAARENSTRCYDAGEQLCRFLHSRNQLLPIYRDLRDNGKRGESAADVMTRTTGLGLDGLEKAWHAWLLKEK